MIDDINNYVVISHSFNWRSRELIINKNDLQILNEKHLLLRIQVKVNI